jgi:hypothetical protein
MRARDGLTMWYDPDKARIGRKLLSITLYYNLTVQAPWLHDPSARCENQVLPEIMSDQLDPRPSQLLAVDYKLGRDNHRVEAHIIRRFEFLEDFDARARRPANLTHMHCCAHVRARAHAYARIHVHRCCARAHAYARIHVHRCCALRARARAHMHMHEYTCTAARTCAHAHMQIAHASTVLRTLTLELCLGRCASSPSTRTTFTSPSEP